MLQAALRDLAGSVNFASGSWQIASEWQAGAGRVFDSTVGQFFAGLQAASSGAYGTRVRFGVDYAITPMFTLRTGLNDDLDATQSGVSVNGGFGIRYGALSLEYAYTPQEYFSSAHTFSLSYHFGSPHGFATNGATVPTGDPAPPIPNALPDTPANSSSQRNAGSAPTTFVLVAGTHASLESAQAEVRTLELLKIPAEAEPEGPRFRVVVGRFATFDAADRARSEYRAKGHSFQIIAR
jgi:hypothetical protein